MSTQLPLEKYTELWEKCFAKITKQTMPSYDDYIIRHNFFEEYLNSLGGTKVRYILVAEAAPYSGAYFYNYELPCGLITPYFKQVVKAFDLKHEIKLTKENALKTLTDITQKGILLLDLFPFALTFTTALRNILIQNGAVKEFWDGYDYSIKTQIIDLCKSNNITLDPEWDLCLIAPPVISTEIVENYKALDVKPCTNGNHNQKTFKAIFPHELRRSKYKKVGVSNAGYPNMTLIKIAFDL
jgi:hypothetical protein